MDSLPAEMKHKILQTLPGNDVRRLTRLNRSFRDLIHSEKNRLPKPTLAIVLGSANPDIAEDFAILTLRSKNLNVDIKLQNEGDMEIMNTSQVITTFLQPFLDQYPPETRSFNGEKFIHHLLFISWLFHTTHVDRLKIIPARSWKDYLELITTVMEETRNSCGLVDIVNRNDMFSGETFRDTQLLREFCRVQHSLQVETRLLVKFKQVPDVWQPSFVMLWNLYGTIFKQVDIELDYRWFLALLFNIQYSWKLNLMQSVKFRLRIMYRWSIVPCRRAINHGFTFESNIDEQKLLSFKKFESFDQLPSEIICTRRDNDSTLIFGIEKEGKCAVVTVRIL